jgi:hypothetical protein
MIKKFRLDELAFSEESPFLNVGSMEMVDFIRTYGLENVQYSISSLEKELSESNRKIMSPCGVLEAFIKNHYSKINLDQ